MNTKRGTKVIAVAIGDVGGIGPEVALKAISAELNTDNTRYLLLGDEESLRNVAHRLALPITWLPYGERETAARVCVHNPASTASPEGQPSGSPAAAQAALAWLRAGAQFCLDGRADALVTAPINKESIIRSGENDFIGQTEFLSALAGTSQTAMMLVGCDDRGRWLRVTLATTHLPIARVAQALNRERIESSIRLTSKACHDLGLRRARIAVCALNPHAGEGGKLGSEEITIIAPAVETARLQGIDVVGPLAADTLFHYAYRGDYDAVIAMYHDQGLVPLKMIGFESGVNWTLGLPFVRTSPDHGTAYDIAGLGIANPGSMISAIRLARKLVADQPSVAS